MKPTWLASIKWQIVWQAAYPPVVPGSPHAEFGSTEKEKREANGGVPTGGRGLVRFSANLLSNPMDTQAENLYLTPSKV
jgi:hypothetical protein